MKVAIASLVAVVVACSASDPVPTVREMCGTSMSAYCADQGCPRTLDDARKDPHMCRATVVPCGSYQVVTVTGIDTFEVYYYQGSLVAREFARVPGGISCTAGPATFDAPRCDTPGEPLQMCDATP